MIKKKMKQGLDKKNLSMLTWTCMAVHHNLQPKQLESGNYDIDTNNGM